MMGGNSFLESYQLSWGIVCGRCPVGMGSSCQLYGVCMGYLASWDRLWKIERLCFNWFDCSHLINQQFAIIQMTCELRCYSLWTQPFKQDRNSVSRSASHPWLWSCDTAKPTPPNSGCKPRVPKGERSKQTNTPAFNSIGGLKSRTTAPVVSLFLRYVLSPFSSPSHDDKLPASGSDSSGMGVDTIRELALRVCDSSGAREWTGNRLDASTVLRCVCLRVWWGGGRRD